MKLIVIVDGDNTLWDTNRRFADAQLALLEQLAAHGHHLHEEDRLAVPRVVDRSLIEHYGVKEYDFQTLAVALIRLTSGATAEEAARSAVSHPPNENETLAAQDAIRAFRETMTRLPDLLPGTPELLHFLEDHRKTRQLRACLVSEGRPQRIQEIVRRHRLDRFLDGVAINAEKRTAMQTFIEDGRRSLGADSQPVVVGDSLRWDIAPGNAVGAITIYRPGGSLGVERAASGDQEPGFSVTSSYELIQVLTSLLRSRIVAVRPVSRC